MIMIKKNLAIFFFLLILLCPRSKCMEQIKTLSPITPSWVDGHNYQLFLRKSTSLLTGILDINLQYNPSTELITFVDYQDRNTAYTQSLSEINQLLELFKTWLYISKKIRKYY